MNQAVIETTVCVRLSLWAIRQYQSSNHTASAHWFDLIQGGEEGAAVCWGNMSCQLRQPVSKLAATAAPSRGTRDGRRWSSGESVMLCPLAVPSFSRPSSLSLFLFRIHTCRLKTDDHGLRPCQRGRRGRGQADGNRSLRWVASPWVCWFGGCSL